MNLQDYINIELIKRDAESYASEQGLRDIPMVVVVPSCNCGIGLDDRLEILRCPLCGMEGVENGRSSIWQG